MTVIQDCFAIQLKSEMPHLQRYALSIAGNPESADDLVQTALERALSNKERLPRPEQLRPWLFTVVRNAHRDEFRKVARRGTAMPIDDVAGEIESAPTQVAHLELDDVTRGIESLQPHEQEVLTLRAFEGLTESEIAARIGIAVGTVKSRLSRARKHLSAYH